MKAFIFVIFLFGLFPLLTMCQNQTVETMHSYSYSENIESVLSNKCPYIGIRNCKENLECEQICENLYSQSKHQNMCKKLSFELVTEFKSIVNEVSLGAVDMNLDILQCLLDINEEPLITALESLSKTESQNFLLQIAKDASFSRLLKKEDRNGDILNVLFEEVGYNSIKEVLREPHVEFNFLYQLGLKNKESAFEYFDRYVEDECSSCQNPIRLYCQGFVKWEEEVLKNFLNQSKAFSENYSEYVLEQNYAYHLDSVEDQVGNFSDYCALRASTIYSKASCPEIEEDINRDYLLGEIVLNEENIYTSSLFDQNEKGISSSHLDLLENSQIESETLEEETLSNLKPLSLESLEGYTPSLLQKENQIEDLKETSQTILVQMVFEEQKLLVWLNVKNTNPYILYLKQGSVTQKFFLSPLDNENTSFKKYEAFIENNTLNSNETISVYLAQAQEGECVFTTVY